MPAGIENYNGRKLRDETTTTLVEHHEAQWMGLSMAQIKEYFYLDYVFICDRDGVIGFIGGCEFGSPNYRMHNTSRLGSLVVHADVIPGNWQDYRLYTDAGLNTKGKGDAIEVISTVIFDMRISAKFKASYFAQSIQYGFRGRQRNAGNSAWENWTEQNIHPDYGVIAAKAEASYESYRFDTVRRGMEYEIQPFFTNEEGTYYGDPVYILPTAKAVTFYGDPNTYYIDTEDIGEGTRLYDGQDFSGYHEGPTGTGEYWIDDRYYWRYGYDVFSDAYVFLELVDGNPPQPVEPYHVDYDGYSPFSRVDAENQVVGNANQYSGTLWYNATEEMWYSGWNQSTGFQGTPDDGWYAWGDISGVEGSIQLISGQQQN